MRSSNRPCPGSPLRSRSQASSWRSTAIFASYSPRADVEDVGEVERLAAHLLHDAVDVLGPAMHFGAHTLRAQLVLDARAQLLHVLLALDALLVQQLRHLPVHVGVEEAEGEVLHL